MFWILHRKQEALFALYLLAAVGLLILGGLYGGPGGALIAWGIPSFALFPLYADRLYFAHVRRRVEKAKRAVPDDASRLAHLKNGGLLPGKKRRAGLAESAIVIVIIGLLATVACGCFDYADYTLRAKCSEAILACMELKAQVAEFAVKNGRLPKGLDELEKPVSAASKYVKLLQLRSDASIIASLQGEKEFEGRVIILQPTLEGSKVSWVCGTPDPGFYKHLPPSCRENLK